jgi:hypothetical protein
MNFIICRQIAQVFEKSGNFFRRKLSKIVTITSTLDPLCGIKIKILATFSNWLTV